MKEPDTFTIGEAGRMTAKLFEQWGLDYALSLLFGVAHDYRPVSLIHCILRNRSDLSALVLSEIGLGEKQSMYVVPDIYTRTPAPLDPLDDYLVGEMETDERFSYFFDPVIRYQSMLRVKLFEVNGWVCFMGLWSKEKEVFCPRDFTWLRAMCAPMVPSLREALSQEASFPVIAMAQQSATNQIRMCTGLKTAVSRMDKCAPTDTTVLITGETGSGKGIMAQAIHEISPRQRRPFVKINCGAIPENLIESELFGHERGAFTGAVAQRKGAFEQANGGTIFLDEIGELPLMAQAKLLHVLDNHEIMRVGGMQRLPLDIRILVATNRDLAQMVRQGTFRGDLYYRVSVYPIHMPPLRERQKDIITLVRQFLMRKGRDMGFDQVAYPHPKEMERLLEYDWPGNVRELEHVVERALIDARFGLGILPLRFDVGTELALEKKEQAASSYWPSLDEHVEEYLCRVVTHTQGRIYGPHGAAALLGIHPSTLKYKLQNLGITIERQTAAKNRR